jgi:hypothetical protein
MPGVGLDLSCPCGFRKKEVWVGVDEAMVHLSFGICLDCRKIFPLVCKPGGRFPSSCHRCGMRLLTPTAPGAWEPAELQRKFPDTEPWLVGNEYYRLSEREEKYERMIEEIRLLCPRCGKYSLTYQEGLLWD